MDGILPLWKPRGLTSHDCVAKIRRLYKTKKVGHTGTLDPEVEGVLPICIGQATKIVSFLTDTKKTYIAEVALGVSTETEDSHGDVVTSAQLPHKVSIAHVNQVLDQFRGSITQVPPMYSAVKVNGKKLYEYARQGQTVDRPKRNVIIHHLELLSGEVEEREGLQFFKLLIVCSKGTYIRTLCVDIGKALGYPAHMSDLVRTQTGGFGEESAVSFEEITAAAAANRQEQLLFPITKGLEHLGVYQVDAEMKKKVLHGQKLFLSENEQPNTDPFRVQHQNELLAVYTSHPTEANIVKPVKVFLHK